MNRLIAVTAAAALALAACRDTASNPLTSPELSPASANVLACNFGVIKPAARTYFSGPLSPIEALISRMQREYLSGNVAATRNVGFDLLAQVAAAHAGTAPPGSPAGTPADGSVLANDILACMSLGVGQTDFSGALGPYGGFAVRGGSSDADGAPIVALGLKSGVAPPAAGFASWLNHTRALFYGAPVPNTSVTEAPVGQQGYVWSTIPTHHADLNGLGTIGICNGASGRDRIQEDGVFITLAPITGLGLDCTTVLGSLGRRGTLLGRLAQAGLTLLLPAPAYAAQDGGTGGLAGGFSQFGVADAGAVHLVIRPVKTSRAGTVMKNVEVVAVGDRGTPLPGVRITLDVESGPGGGQLTGGLVESTNAWGVANFRTLSLDQAGTYTFGATSSFSGFVPAAATSATFQVTP